MFRIEESELKSSREIRAFKLMKLGLAKAQDDSSSTNLAYESENSNYGVQLTDNDEFLNTTAEPQQFIDDGLPNDTGHYGDEPSKDDSNSTNLAYESEKSNYGVQLTDNDEFPNTSAERQQFIEDGLPIDTVQDTMGMNQQRMVVTQRIWLMNLKSQTMEYN
ncbi:uncharacterized protein LOC120352409 [Nilaparvata lugens]|uniref:uncharacterized protein LOC120352409 n=1 Tax=Nilaparvata lugens TaxID=108931 RepID=UPI00193D21D7|nr:uncharacterized protein LOC120352409 [Nilaparvata lugens]